MSYSFAVGKVDPIGGMNVNIQQDAAGASESTQQRRLLELVLLELRAYNANFLNAGIVNTAATEEESIQ